MILLVLGGALTLQWMPIGSKNGVLLNLFVVGVLLGSLFGLLHLPEVEHIVGKLGRADSALDPAPITMIEAIITYKPQSQWRSQIHSADDIFAEIQKAAEIPGITSSPKLHPIENRLIMLQSGIRAKMAVKITGPSLSTIQDFGLHLEPLLKTLPQVDPSSVIADRVVGKPTLEIQINRQALAQYGLRIDQVQNTIEMAIGGKLITQTIENRERYAVRIRYLRDYRDSFESLGRLCVDVPGSSPIPLSQVARISYVQGPLEIKSENTFLTSYVLFDKRPGLSDIDVVNAVKNMIDTSLQNGRLKRPDNVNFSMTGNFENLIRSEKRFAVIIPLALATIFLILMVQFRSIVHSLMVFSSIFVAWSGGFILLWLFGQDWFLALPIVGNELRDVFHISPVYLSVAVWVGFLALFGVASNDAVLMTTYLNDVFKSHSPKTVADIRKNVILGAARRVRPCLMTAATAIIALLPILTSNGKGADIMRPMALPTLGGMTLIVLVSLFVTPVLYCVWEEYQLKE